MYTISIVIYMVQSASLKLELCVRKKAMKKKIKEKETKLRRKRGLLEGVVVVVGGSRRLVGKVAKRRRKTLGGLGKVGV